MLDIVLIAGTVSTALAAGYLAIEVWRHQRRWAEIEARR
jgi:hypothetical protein